VPPSGSAAKLGRDRKYLKQQQIFSRPMISGPQWIANRCCAVTLSARLAGLPAAYRCLSHPVFFEFPTVHSASGNVINVVFASEQLGVAGKFC
jgi:hypothetical protein